MQNQGGRLHHVREATPLAQTLVRRGDINGLTPSTGSNHWQEEVVRRRVLVQLKKEQQKETQP